MFTLPVRVYYEDTDLAGVVYHANYVKFFERARTEMLRAQGINQSQLIEDNGVIFAVRAMQIDYLVPAKFDDLLAATAEITLVKKASFTFEQSILRDGEVICKATVRIASLDAATLRPKAIPVFLLEHLTNEH